MREDFRPILGYEGHYEINSEGVVFSIKFGKRKVMKTTITNKGYQVSGLYINGRQHFKLVHRLVWEAFNGKIEDGLHVLHGKNTTCDNCCLENLSLGTHKDNMGRDRRRDGTLSRGEKHGNAKLTEVQVKYIKARIRDKQKQRTLSNLFNVSDGTICCIKQGSVWSHVA